MPSNVIQGGARRPTPYVGAPGRIPLIGQFRLLGSFPTALLAILFALYAAYALLFPAPAKPDATWTRIRDQGILRIGIDPSFPPFESDDGKGNLSGYDIALGAAIASKWNVRVQYVYTGFDGLYDALVGNQFDVILSALPYNPEKTQDVLFSHSYFDGGPVIVVRADDSTTKDLYTLAQRPVAVELGTSGDGVARKWQRRLKLDLREFNTANEALVSVQKGQTAAALVDPISFYDFAKSTTGSLKAVGRPLENELYIIAVRKDSPTLLREVNAVIDVMKQDGTMDSLQKRWF